MLFKFAWTSRRYIYVLQNVKAEIIANKCPGYDSYTGKKDQLASDLMWVQLQKDVWLI